MVARGLTVKLRNRPEASDDAPRMPNRFCARSATYRPFADPTPIVRWSSELRLRMRLLLPTVRFCDLTSADLPRTRLLHGDEQHCAADAASLRMSSPRSVCVSATSTGGA